MGKIKEDLVPNGISSETKYACVLAQFYPQPPTPIKPTQISVKII